MPSGWVVGYATSTMWQEVERPAQTLAGASLAHIPFEQRVRRLSRVRSSHCDKTILQRLLLAGAPRCPARPSVTRLTRRLATTVAGSNATLRRYRPASTADRSVGVHAGSHILKGGSGRVEDLSAGQSLPRQWIAGHRQRRYRVRHAPHNRTRLWAWWRVAVAHPRQSR
jgi:hypothetical protein